MLGFDKENTATSLGNLMTLAQAHPRNSEIRFHVGLLFFWLKDRQDTIAQMRQVLANDPHGPYSAVAKVFIACLDNPEWRSLHQAADPVTVTTAGRRAPIAPPAWWPPPGPRRSAPAGR